MLEQLTLSSNNITTITFLSNLSNLKGLNLDHNQISNISSLTQLTKMEELTLNSNNINDLSPILGFRNLSKLEIINNPLEDCNYEPLIRLNNPGVEIKFDPNPNFITADFTGDCQVQFLDFAFFATYWLKVDCFEENNWCGGCDFTKDGNVRLNDFYSFTLNWLTGVY